MQKKVLVFAVAAAMGLPAAAMADTTLYGRLNVSMDYVDDGVDSSHQLASNSSRLGVRGSEDLGMGLRGVFQIEAALQGNEGRAFDGSNLTARNTYVGLAGGFGELRIGKHDTPYKLSTLRLNFFADTLGDMHHVAAQTGNNANNFYRRNDNTLIYMTPDFGGMQFMASYTTDLVDDTPNNNPDANDTNAFSLAGVFSQGPMYVAVAYEQNNNFGVGGEDQQAWKVGGTYQIADLTLAAMYENIDDGQDDRDAFHLGARYSFGQAYLMASYTFADELTTDNGAKMYALGGGFNFSRRTGIYAVYALADNDDAGRYGLTGSGKGKGVGAVVAGEDVSGFQIGVTHNF
ncbi:Outer membrane protein (porin) [Ectothiorhodospira magna]|uniref:Outer membrane protein (Porin) n=1 Tax=Ectothiorhodospira magna TaxID=867345 RepID=A0A1H8ZA47_9GAMM|nr:porin [Ectothiorhodospira magna]SEP61276.1 Outer membrane protein (porin) [Ectothiorhodospira magna]